SPGLAAIIAEHRVNFPTAIRPLIERHENSAGVWASGQLEANPRSRRRACHGGRTLYLTGHLERLRPIPAVVLAFEFKGSANLAPIVSGFRLMVNQAFGVALIPQEPPGCFAQHYGGWIVQRVLAVLGKDLQWPPGLAGIGAAAQHDVILCMIMQTTA